ncbi:MAG: GNAT family N-acetyltransferase [Candidatus Acidiferrum sp.]
MNAFETEGYPRFRFAAQRDVGALTKLINVAFVVEQPFLEGPRIDEEGTLAFLETGKFLIAEDSAGIAGCVYCELRGDRGYLGLLAVDPPRQGAGLGRQLVAVAEEYFRGEGCVAVDLRIISQRAPLLAFYRRLGYVESGTVPFSASVPAKVPGYYLLMSKMLA